MCEGSDSSEYLLEAEEGVQGGDDTDFEDEPVPLEIQPPVQTRVRKVCAKRAQSSTNMASGERQTKRVRPSAPTEVSCSYVAQLHSFEKNKNKDAELGEELDAVEVFKNCHMSSKKGQSDMAREAIVASRPEGQRRGARIPPPRPSAAGPGHPPVIHLDLRTASTSRVKQLRMEQFHLLEPYYEENHRGRRIAEGEELPHLRPRTHDKFQDMRYDDRYTPLLERAGLDVISYQVRRGLPVINSAGITALVDRWRPETHSFHLPCGEMTVTLQDSQKFLGLRVRGRPVMGHCRPDNWRARVEAFLGRELPPEAPGTRTSGVPITWLRQNFAECPEVADEQTVTFYCRAWVLHLFGCVLFPDATGDSASWMYLPCLTDWDMAGGYSWASGVLAFLYRHLCEACRRTSQHSSIGGCVYLLQLWMWSRLPVGRPTVLAPRPWFQVANARHRPTVAYLWDRVKVPFARTTRAYVEYTNELDTLTPSMVSWQPYDDLQVVQLGLSTMCNEDDDLYMMRCPLICFYAVEYHLPHRVARQFGLRQEWPVEPFSTSVDLHKIDRQKQKKTFDFETLHRDHIDMWGLLHENVYQNDQPHTNYNFRAYLSWYVGVTRSRLKRQWTQADYADMESSDDEDTSYDLATRQGTQVEAAPILDRVGNSLRQSVIDIERFSMTRVDDNTRTFLARLARRLRRAAGRCGCRTSVGVDVHGPATRLLDTTVVLGTSSHSDAGSRGQSSSCATVDTFQGHGGEEEERGYEELGLSQLHDAPST